MKARRILALLLAALLLCGFAACKEASLSDKLSEKMPPQPQPDIMPDPNAKNDPEPEPEPGSEPEPEPEPEPEFLPWVYEAGGVTVALPAGMAEPAETEKGILFSDPEGKWTAEFQPLDGRDTEITVTNLTALLASFADFGYYRDPVTEETELGGRKAWRFAFSRNPDWVEASMGYTASYTEANSFWVVDFGDDVIAGHTGLLIDVSAPEKTTENLGAILADGDLQILLGHLEFAAPMEDRTLGFPGLSVRIPARWDARSNDKDRLEIGVQGTVKANITFQSSIYADPVKAAGTVGDDYRTVTAGAREWYGGLRVNDLGEKPVYTLVLYTAFTRFHCLELSLTMVGGSSASPEETWAYAESDAFRALLESVELDPEAFHDPEKDRMDDSGLEANNVGEVSGYTGAASELVIPAVIGTTPVKGINVNVFKGNETLTSVTILEGITYIGHSAFKDCVNLKTVVLPASLTLIDNEAFSGCTSLETVVFSGGLMTIETGAFRGCAALKEVTLPDTVKKIGESAFYRAGDGTGSFTCPADGVAYGAGALYGVHFRSVKIGPNADLSAAGVLHWARVEALTVGEGCTALGESFFAGPTYNDEEGMWHYYDDAIRLELPGSIKRIGDYAFRGRLGLTEFDFTGVETLGRSCFEDTGLVEIRIPGTIREIPENAFNCCRSAKTIVLEEGVEVVGEYAFASCGVKENERKGMYYWTLGTEDYEKYKKVMELGGSAPDLSCFLQIELPSTLKQVKSGAFSFTYIEAVWLLWCTDPQQITAIFDPEAFYGIEAILQVYFTRETIEACGDALDQALLTLEDVGEVAWYDIGYRYYWSRYGTKAELDQAIAG